MNPSQIPSTALPSTNVPSTEPPAIESKTGYLIALIAIPLLGIAPGAIVAGCYFFIKGLHKNRQWITAAGLTLIVAGAVTLWAFIALMVDVKKWDEQAIRQETLEASEINNRPATPVTIGDKKVAIFQPVAMKLISDTPDKKVFGTNAAGTSESAAGTITIERFPGYVVGISNIENMIASQQYQTGVTQTLNQVCPYAQMRPPETTSVAGDDVKSSYKIVFICPPKDDRSDKGGYMVDIFTGNDMYRVIIAAERKTWLANEKAWDAVLTKLEILNPQQN